VTPEELARHLTAERKRQKITQQEVADYIGCHISQVQALEYRPDVNRKLQSYLNYAEAIGMELDFSTRPLGT
jgi:transcriptional regulator with XRE-family HTH domain